MLALVKGAYLRERESKGFIFLGLSCIEKERGSSDEKERKLREKKKKEEEKEDGREKE